LKSASIQKNSQLITLATIPKEGESEKLLFNMNLQELTDDEMLSFEEGTSFNFEIMR